MEEYIGWIAVIFFIIGGLFRCPKTVISIYTSGSVLYIFKYLSMGLYTPAISMTCTVLCNIGFLKVNKQYLVHCLFTALIVSSCLILFNFESQLELLILIAGWLVAYANFNRDNYINHKLATIMSQCLWAIYTINYNDYPMLCICVAIALTNSYSLIINLYKDNRFVVPVIAPSPSFAYVRNKNRN